MSAVLDPTLGSFWQPIATAFLCGALIGLERQLRGKPAGIRTATLICLSTAVFVSLGRTVLDGSGDPSRVLGQVVTGVGFLGGGVMLAREGIVYGVTTAAVIWMLAAIGATIGFGHLRAAIVLALLTLLALVGIEVLESRLSWLRRGIYARLHRDEARPTESRTGRRATDPGHGPPPPKQD
jgi:putative Mg2+ transporter-C (MgtC) family protein